MYSYTAYGLRIHSELLIPEFIGTSDNESVDAAIHFVPHANLEPYRNTTVLQRKWDLDLSDKSAVFYVEEVGAFTISDGNSIMIMPAPECTEEIIRLYLLGTVMSILLYQRGLLVLHGSVVEIEHRAAIFLGASGAGKSTTTVALHNHGHRILADDIAAIDMRRTPMTVAAGSPQIKVGPEVAKTLGYDFDSLHQLHPLERKRGYRFQEDFSLNPLSVQRIYVLDFGEDMKATALTLQNAVIELVRHSRPTTLKFCGGMAHFLQCVQLAKAFPVYRLERPRSLERLSEFSTFIDSHAHNHNLELSIV